MKGGNFVLNILKEAKGKESIEVSVNQTVSPTSSVHLARATLELLEKKAAGGIYHLVNEGCCSWYEFAKEIFSISGISIRVIPIERGEVSVGVRRPIYSALANIRAKALGVVLPQWQDGLREYLEEIKRTVS